MTLARLGVAPVEGALGPLPGGEGAVIDTDAGPTFVRSLGSGMPVVVFHGGPGFDHTYLVEPLASLTGRRRLVFYDQAGCGRTPRPADGVTIAATIAQARALLRMVAASANGRVGVIAHSWGALVLVAAYSAPAGGDARDGCDLPLLAEGALINPVAVTRKEWDAASQRLLSGASPRQLADFTRRLEEGDGAGAMAVALPIYTRSGYARETGPFPLNAATYLAVTGSLGEIDYSAGARALAHLTLVNGTDDFTGPDLLAPLMAHSAKVLHPALGHFPFFEAPAKFAALIDGVFR
jgi:pimeloyl-ACP methyl ester carboxylesterase